MNEPEFDRVLRTLELGEIMAGDLVEIESSYNGHIVVIRGRAWDTETYGLSVGRFSVPETQAIQVRLYDRPVPESVQPWIAQALVDARDRADDVVYELKELGKITREDYFRVLRAVDPAFKGTP